MGKLSAKLCREGFVFVAWNFITSSRVKGSHSSRATIPKAGHGSARENPQAFNEAVLKFLAKHKP